MLSLPKLALVSLVVIAIGALQQAVPAFTGEQSKLITSQPSNSSQLANLTVLSNQAVTSYQDTESGTLYLITNEIIEDVEGNKATSKTSISPLLNTKVDIKVNGIVARTKLTQSFKNASENWVNGMYVFPLPENAAVDHLMMTIGDRKIEGQIKEKLQAKKLFTQAKSEGKKVSLVAQHRPNVFSNQIANIGPNETIEISIEYQQILNLQEQEYSLRFPMTVAPRYTPANSNEIVDTPIPMSKISPDQNIQLSVNLQAGFELNNIESEFHPITQSRLPDGSYKITLNKDSQVNRDFVLHWQPELGADPKIAHLTQQINGDEYGLIMINAPNSKEFVSALPREVIFVLDTSGSMEGESIIQAKQALLLAIDQLNEQDSFNLIEFNSRAQNLWRVPKKVTATTKKQAADFVNSLKANGGTEIHRALNLAFSLSANQTTESNMSQVIFITDGSVANEESLMQLIKSKIGYSRLFTVGIGSAPNTYFMSEAAEMGRGTFTYIGSTSQVQQKMAGLLTKLKHPTLTDIELLLSSSIKNPKQKIEIYPKKISDLYLGEPLIVSYKVSQPPIETEDSFGKITLIGRYRDQDWQQQLPKTVTSREAGLNVLWARKKIKQLSQDKRRAQMQPTNSEDLQSEYQSQITNTALEHHIVSQYTSLIAIDVTPTKPMAEHQHTQKQADLLAKAKQNRTAKMVGSLPQTATPAELKMIMGLFIIGLAICMHLLTKRKV
ncbi:marine proteobacterial sortase target protein [uncultured Paraglaciecola sp.]|uniref:marine proteobacterial sortase target protein n=1 Tax=uncultured Paraglaciecola sp. TaxID=1765024 RepID=UPI0025953CB4|nr:marine proteobacterial sortase target protein [uncultured Paraglaciecola sp.]